MLSPETGRLQIDPSPIAIGVVQTNLTAWMPALIGMLVICCESTRVMGADHTTAWLSRLCSPIIGLATADVIELNHILRKSGHFIGYGTLGVVYVRGWMSLLVRRRPEGPAKLRALAGALAVLSAFLIAGMDELHQSYLPNRSACFSDVLLDTSGAILFVLIAWYCSRLGCVRPGLNSPSSISVHH